MNTHEIFIQWSYKDACFVAMIPGVQRLRAYGDARPIALKELGILAATYPEYVEGCLENILQRKDFLHLCPKNTRNNKRD